LFPYSGSFRFGVEEYLKRKKAMLYIAEKIQNSAHTFN